MVKKVLENRRLLVMAGIGILALLAVLLTLTVLPSLLSRDQIILASIDRGDEADLSLLRLGQTDNEAITLARNVKATQPFILVTDGKPSLLASAIGFGGFIPNTNQLLYWYLDGDNTIVNQVAVNGKRPTQIFESKAADVSGVVFSNRESVFLSENINERQRCYMSRAGKEADRLGKGDVCTVSPDGSHLFITEAASNRTTLTMVNTESGDETALAEEKDGIKSVLPAFDGSRVAYLTEQTDGTRIVLLDTKKMNEIAESDRVTSIVGFGFPQKGNILYYIAENDTGELTLYTLDDNRPVKVVSGYSLNAEFSSDGKYLVYVVADRDGEQTLSVHAMSGTDDSKILSSPDIQFDLVNDPDRILIKESSEGELTISSVGVGGQDLRKLYDESDVTLKEAYYLAGESQLYLILESRDGTGLYATPIDQETGFMVVDEWSEITLLNRSHAAKEVIFSGQEEKGDNMALFATAVEKNSKPELLDDDFEAIINAVVTPNNTEVIYTVLSDAGTPQIDVRRVRMDGEKHYTDLYRDNLLVDVRWDHIAPFSSLLGLGSGSATVAWTSGLRGVTYCPGADVLSLGGRQEGELKEGKDACYRLEVAAGQMYSITAKSSMDTSLELYTQKGKRITGNDDGGEGFNPLLRTMINTPGVYFVVLHPTGDSTASFAITFNKGVGDPAFDNAIHLGQDSRIRGAIISSSKLTLRTSGYTTYGTMYYFDGTSNERVVIDVLSDSIGSQMDSNVHLYSPYLVELAGDDDSGSGLDSRLTYTLPTDGRYYVLVECVRKDYGGSSSHYYQIQLTVR